jgi:hypothetical protein
VESDTPEVQTRNPFPDSEEKGYLRRLHLLQFSDYRRSIGRELAYLGLPSAEMLDVRTWQAVLGHVTAIERDPDVALELLRTAQLLGTRSKTILLQMSAYEAARLLAAEEEDARLILSELTPLDQKHLQMARNVKHDMVYLDLYGGFLYSKERGESDNLKTLTNIIRFQAKHKQPFWLLATFNLRDTGADDYDSFLQETFSHLETDIGVDTSILRAFYLSEGSKDGQPRQLRRLRLCFPAYMHKIAFGDFQVRRVTAWYYKKLYHAVLFFEPRRSEGLLGLAWPPMDEFKELLRAELERLQVEQGSVVAKTLPAPSLD